MNGHEYVSALRQSIMFLRTNTGIFKPASYVLIAVACVALLRRDRTMLFLAGLLLASICVFFAAQLIKPIIYQKTVWWMTGLVVILVSGAIARLRPLPLRIAALGLLSALLIADLIVARPGFRTHDWPGFVRFAARHPASPVVLLGKEAAIIFDEACRAEYRQQCPVRSVVLLRKPLPRSWADEYSGPLLMWTPGDPAPIGGPVILLRDDNLSDQWAIPRRDEFSFGTLEVSGPAPLQDLLRPR